MQWPFKLQQRGGVKNENSRKYFSLLIFTRFKLHGIGAHYIREISWASSANISTRDEERGGMYVYICILGEREREREKLQNLL